MHDPVSPSPSVPERLARNVLQPLEHFLHVEAASGVVLLLATTIALVWANSPWAASYDALWHAPVTIGLGARVASQSLHFWINDGLMTIFFLVVGLEIRREMQDGALASLRLAALPLAAALGGVAAPALIYLALNSDPALRHAWAVPTATDIAFAVGLLALLGKRVPPALRVLLLAIAIVDDIVAILIIAFFYSSGIEVFGLLVAAAGVLLVLAMQRLGFGSALGYVIPGVIVWSGMLYAGIHPTLAGVVLGVLTPVSSMVRREGLLADAGTALKEMRDPAVISAHDMRKLLRPAQRLRLVQREMVPPVVRVEAALHPWVAYIIIPLFALANAGVNLGEVAPAFASAATLIWGVVLGLVIGKPLGISIATWLSLKLGLAALPAAVDAKGILLVGCLAGIGFTMSIFIANLAFADASLLAATKLAVLIGSFSAAVLGLTLGRLVLRRRD